MSSYIEYDGSYYAIDMNAIMEFVSGSTNDPANGGSTVTQTYGIPNFSDDEGEIKPGKFQLLSKDITESKSGINDNLANIRYDMIKNLLSILLINQANEAASTSSPSNFDFGQLLAFNTLLAEKIIYEINDNGNYEGNCCYKE